MIKKANKSVSFSSTLAAVLKPLCGGSHERRNYNVRPSWLFNPDQIKPIMIVCFNRAAAVQPNQSLDVSPAKLGRTPAGFSKKAKQRLVHPSRQASWMSASAPNLLQVRWDASTTPRTRNTPRKCVWYYIICTFSLTLTFP
jgi:hypothetical protein